MKLESITAREIEPYILKAAGAGWPYIRDDIERQIAEAWRVNDGQAHLVTRIEVLPSGGHELVIMCLQGKGWLALAREIIERAKRLGFQSVRAHTSRRGIYKWMQDINAEEYERVYKINLR